MRPNPKSLRRALALAVVVITLLAATAHPLPAQTPAVAPGFEAEASGVITPAGGEVSEERSQFRITFPPNAVDEAVTVRYETGIAPPTPLDPEKHAINYFMLSAQSESGEERVRFNKEWVIEVGYEICDSEADCDPVSIDEASLRCESLDVNTQQWTALSGTVDVFAKVVRCRANHFSNFALVAKPLDTGGAADTYYLWLPSVRM